MFKANYKKVQRQVEELDTLLCSRCDVELKELFPGCGSQRDGVLIVKLIGGYGMYFDDMDEGPIVSALCKDCAAKLHSEWPILFQTHQ